MKAIQRIENNLTHTDSKITSMSLNGLKTAIKRSKTEAKRFILLLDCSGSMDAQVVNGKRRIDILRESLMGINGDIIMIAFSNQPRKVDSIPEPSGSTAMHLAIDYAGQFLNGQKTKVILISDGEPNCEDSALQSAESLPCKIDTIFCGDEGSEGERFLKKLAALKDGQHNIVNWDSPIVSTQLENKVRALLN